MSKLLKKLSKNFVDFWDWLKRLICGKNLHQKIIIALGLLVGGLVITLIFLFLSVSRSEINLAKLRSSWEKNKICHEVCSLERKVIVKEIIKDLQLAPDSKSLKIINKYFSDSEISSDLKKELVRIVGAARAGNNPPDFLRDYLASPIGEDGIKEKILISFSPASLIDGKGASSSPSDYYFNILKESKNTSLQRAAIKSLSNLSDKKEYLGLENLEFIKGMIFDSGTNINLRRDLIMLLGDYYLLFPKETAGILRGFYKADPSGDDIARAFAADILNRLSGANLKIPEITQEEWSSYYNN